MKKKIAALLLGTSLLLAGCAKTQESAIEFTYEPVQETTAVEETVVESQTYLLAGRYYTCGELHTKDGNVWEYSQELINEKPSYDNQPVFALIDDMGTGNQHDDVIIGLVFDAETAIYDELEIKLAESFNVTRDGNNLHLDPK